MKLQDGPAVINEIKRQMGDIISSGRQPEIVVMGGYYHFLLKTHHQTTVDTTTNKSFPFNEYEVDGHKLLLLLRPEAAQGGCVKEANYTLKVYGD